MAIAKKQQNAPTLTAPTNQHHTTPSHHPMTQMAIAALYEVSHDYILSEYFFILVAIAVSLFMHFICMCTFMCTFMCVWGVCQGLCACLCLHVYVCALCVCVWLFLGLPIQPHNLDGPAGSTPHLIIYTHHQTP